MALFNMSELITITKEVADYLIVVVEQISRTLALLDLPTTLIVVTLVVTLISYRSQSRAGVREAIEHLDPRALEYYTYNPYASEYNRSYFVEKVQVKPGLNGFSFTKRRAKIGFSFNHLLSREDRVVGHSVPPYYLTIGKHPNKGTQTLKARILSHPLITNVERDEDQIVVTCSSSNPVECRKVASYVLDEHDSSLKNIVLRDDYYP